MSSRLERKLEEIQQLLGKLAAEASKGIPIVVEGKNDVRALRKLEVTGDIICAKSSGRTFLDVLQEIEKKQKDEVILLLDFDKRGREGTRCLAKNLERMKIKPNRVFWRKLYGFVGREVKDIEGLSSYLRNFRAKIGKAILDAKQ